MEFDILQTMKNLMLSCLAGIALVAVTGCASDREQPVSTTTTTEESTTVHHPVNSTTTETTVHGS
jgi:hypothetical protein